MEEDHIAFKVFKILASIILGMLTCMCITFIIYSNDREADSFSSPERISYEVGKSEFNRETILSQISNGEIDVFFETELPAGDVIPEEYVEANHFSDEELYEIAKYYLRANWDEDPDDWRLVNTGFSIYDCENGFDGPFSAGYHFQKMVTIDGEEYRDEISIRIDVWRDMIVWNDKVEDYTRLSSDVNLEKIKIKGFEAYQIAEENGGMEYYTESDNACREIGIRMYGNDWYWNVDYWSEEINVDSLFLEINRRTGAVRRK